MWYVGHREDKKYEDTDMAGPSEAEKALQQAENGARAEAAGSGEAQLELLPPLPLPGAAGGVLDAEAERRRQPGRPRGALNRRSQDLIDYVLARYRSPVVGMVEIYSRPVGDLARQLGCTLHEAFAFQLEAMKHAAPYLHSKMPVALDVTGKGLVALSIVDPSRIVEAAAAEAPAEAAGFKIGGALIEHGPAN
jgi:hypothetical protein